MFLSFSDKATNPSNRQEDWEYIMGFCDQINKELEGYGHVHSIKECHAHPMLLNTLSLLYSSLYPYAFVIEFIMDSYFLVCFSGRKFPLDCWLTRSSPPKNGRRCKR